MNGLFMFPAGIKAELPDRFVQPTAQNEYPQRFKFGRNVGGNVAFGSIFRGHDNLILPAVILSIFGRRG
jgi:hypothetical protein